jgi:hypothetical protein
MNTDMERALRLTQHVQPYAARTQALLQAHWDAVSLLAAVLAKDNTNPLIE